MLFPNFQLGGLYALFSGDKLLYIGLGASKGGGIYKDRGISRRLLAHVLEIAPKNSPLSYVPQDRWKDLQVDLVATIGFPEDRNYLACALEDYLIGKLLTRYCARPPNTNRCRFRRKSLP